MKKLAIVLVLLVAIVGGLKLAAIKRAPKPAPPTTQKIWKNEGIPVSTASVEIGNMEQTVDVTGDINALKKITLSAKVSGRVSNVYYREGDFVSAGSVVVSLDKEDALSNLQQAAAGLQTAQIRLSQARTNSRVTNIQSEASIAEAMAALRSAKAKLAVVKDPARNQEIMVAQNKVASAKANLDNSEANYKRYQQLAKQGAVSAATFDTYETQYKIAQSDYKSAQQQLSLIKEGGRSEDVLSAQAQVDAAEQQLRTARANASQKLLRKEDIKAAIAAVEQAKATVSLARQQLSYTNVVSPVSGEMSSRTIDPGQVIAAGQSLGEIVNLDSVYFKGLVSETQLDSVRNGQRVVVRIDALPGEVFNGTVAEIFPSGSLSSRNFPVRITIPGTKHLIKVGMFARGEIVTGVSKNVMIVTKDAVLERKGTKMLFTVEPIKTKNGIVHKAKRHDIIVIHENSVHSEIKPIDSVLNVGDVIVTEGRQNLQDGSKLLVK